METSGVLWQQTHGHPPEEVLERYSMACSAGASINGSINESIDEEECEQVEEHLLLCASCRKQLDECDQWVALMKAAANPAAQGITAGSPPPFWQRWWQAASGFSAWPALAGSLAMAVAVLWVAPSVLPSRGVPEPTGAPVSLSAMRGNDLQIRVDAGRSLELKVEDLVSAATVVIVDSDGRQVWTGALQGNIAHVPSLKKGIHWVRLMSASSGEQLKEYGLLVE